MIRKFYLLFAAFSAALTSSGQITIPISLTSGAYTQDFNTLANSGTTNSTTPPGWGLAESGTGANATYALGTGSENGGNTYSYGSSGNTERAFGGLQSGSVIPTIGAAFTNSSGLTITSLIISFTGEQWRLGSTGRVDRMDFQYSTTATSLTTGTWTDADGLDFTAPITTGTVGALDGNASSNKATISFTVNGLNIASGATFYIRWNDFNANGSDDGLAIDDFSLSFSGAAVASTVSVAAGNNAAEPSSNGSFTVTLNTAAPAGGVTVQYSFSGSATLSSDYSDPLNGSITIAQGATTGTINVDVIDDNLVEPAETIFITLASASNSYAVDAATASIQLLDNESSTLFQANFSTCISSLSDGFTQQSVIGTQVWSCSSFGRTGNGLEMNGFANSTNNANEDWLVSPALDLSATANPLLSFYSRTRFTGDALRLFITANYTGDVTTTTWTELNGFFPAIGSDVWTLSENIDLAAFKQANVRFAFKYTSSTTAGARWNLDDISIINSATPPPAIFALNTTLVDFRYQVAGTTTTGKPFGFSLNNLQSNVTLTAPTGFELSKDNSSFAASITYTPAEAQSTTMAYVRLITTSASMVYAGAIQFAATNFNTAPVYVKGNTFDPSSTLNLASWNIRFFGQTGTGSPDPAQQQANAKTIIEALNPDVMAAVEIVDVTRFASLVSSLSGGYSYVLAEHCSGNGTTASACATAQKVGLIYKTSVMTNVKARPYMITSSTATASFASGRVPLLVSGDVTKNGQTTTMNFLVIHAKANTGDASDQITSYNQRKNGNRELKDSLEAQFSSSNIVMLGDFNDDLDRTIAPTTGADTVSSYQNFVADSTDAVSYRSVTLPLSNLKTRSTTDYDNVIDHMIISDEMSSRILRQSATVYTDIQEVTGITNFGTSTSDHYPIMARFFFGGVLPVRLSDFTASKQGAGIQVQWNTAEEINTKEFVVEHSSDGRNFKQIGVVRASNATSGSTYSFLHVQPAAGNNFYRLKTVDFDAKTQLSRVIKMSTNKAFTVSLSPNPAKNSVVVSRAGTTNPVQLELVNASGQVVKTLKLSNSLTSLSLDGLKAGLYLVRLKNGNETMTERLLID